MTFSSPLNKRGVTPAKAMVAAISGYAMDGFDLLILGFMLPAISVSLALTTSQAGSLVTWTLIGAVLGGIFFGHLSDRLGRIRVLTFTILMFSVFTGLCAVAQGYWDLLAYRTLAGMGLGGEFGIGMALIAEVWPAHKRNRASAWVGIGWQLGVLLAAFITPLLLDIIGWRGMFLVGLCPRWSHLPSAAAWENRTRLPKISRHPGNIVHARLDAVCRPRHLEGQYRHPHPLLGTEFWLLWPDDLDAQLSLLQFWLFAHQIRTLDGGHRRGDDLRHLAVRRAGRPFRPLEDLSDLPGGAVVMVIIYAQLRDPTLMLFTGAVMGMFVNGMIGGYGALISDTYPLQVRATAQNVLFNLGRGVGGFGPLVIGLFVSHWSFTAAITLLALLYLLDIFATLFLPKTQGSEDALGAIG
jgi:MFS family permease